MALEQIGKDVYAYLQPDEGLGWSNSGFVAPGGGMIVDTLWDLPKTRAMLDAYASVSSGPARRLVNTHHNGDHCWGNQLCDGAEIIGHRLAAAAMRNDLPPAVFEELSAMTDVPPGMEGFLDALRRFDFSGITITPPTVEIEDRHELDLDGLGVEILYVGPAHTAGDVVVHIPERGIVFAGDVLFRQCTPIGWEGTYAQWLRALDRIAALEPDIVVPGHGPLTDVAGMLEMGEYLKYVRAESRVHFDAGLTPFEAATKIDLGPYAGWTEPERLVFNVHRAYREFRGEPFDAPVDAMSLLTEMGRFAEFLKRR